MAEWISFSPYGWRTEFVVVGLGWFWLGEGYVCWVLKGHRWVLGRLWVLDSGQNVGIKAKHQNVGIKKTKAAMEGGNGVGNEELIWKGVNHRG